jgi:hypothetical protein
MLQRFEDEEKETPILRMGRPTGRFGLPSICSGVCAGTAGHLTTSFYQTTAVRTAKHRTAVVLHH